MEEKSVFYRAVDAVLRKWTALQLAIQHGMGGVDSVSKGRWLPEAIEQYFKENANLDEEEIAEFLEWVMNEEFDTILEDGSQFQVAARLAHLYRLFRDNRHGELLEFIMANTTTTSAYDTCLPPPPPPHSNLVQQPQFDQPIPHHHHICPFRPEVLAPSSSSSAFVSNEEEMETEKIEQEHTEEEEGDDDEGKGGESWQTITRSRRKIRK